MGDAGDTSGSMTGREDEEIEKYLEGLPDIAEEQEDDIDGYAADEEEGNQSDDDETVTQEDYRENEDGGEEIEESWDEWNSEVDSRRQMG